MKKTIETIMEKEFTPLEKVMALGCALMVGFVLGFLLSIMSSPKSLIF